ncbi:MAG: hypothetical protein JRJ72_13145 [Deltaproteobacteria bacterium]|nr:hypothetical protein [Deltaproteobacteria bacterium]
MSTGTPLILAVDQAAEQLATDRAHVLRAISHGKLRAAVIDKSFRIEAGDLAGYVRQGAPGFSAPFKKGAAWFDDSDRPKAEQFLSRVRDAMELQAPDPAVLADQYPDIPVVVPSLSGALAELFKQPVPSGPFGGGEGGESPYRTWGELYLAYRLRSAAGRIVNTDMSLARGNRLERLYSSPAAHQAIVSQATEAVAAEVIGTSKQVEIPQPAGPPKLARLQFATKTGDLIGLAAIREAAAIAF